MDHPTNPTRLPESVTGLVECVRHEIGVIERELDDCYTQKHGGDGDNGTRANTNKNKNEPTRIDLLEDAIDDGFMCVDLRVLERKLRAWHRLFSPAFGNSNNNHGYTYTVTPYFAVKCNPDPVVVRWLARTAARWNLPLGFDCASIAELELAREQIETFRLGTVTHTQSCSGNVAIPTTRIVYANPQRAEADLMKALHLFATTAATPRNELWLTLDGIEEVYKIAMTKERFLQEHQHGPDGAASALVMPKIRVILRIWVPDGHSQVPLGEKFGMRLDHVDGLVVACLEAGFAPEDMIGVSFHCGSGCESVETYLEALAMGRRALNAIDLRLMDAAPTNYSSSSSPPPRTWLLDIGGGFPGVDGLDGDEGRFGADGAATSKSAPPTTPEETNDTNDEHRSSSSPPPPAQTTPDPPLTLIAEPGRYFVEGAFALASRIYQKQVLPRPSDSERGTNGNSNSNNINTPNDDDDDRIRVYRIPHGVQGVFKDVLLCGESFVPQPLQTDEEDNPTAHTQQPVLLYPSRVLGPSGDDAEDVVCQSCLLPELKVGDWLVFDRMGAYTLSIASRAGRPVMRYVLGGGLTEDDDEVEKRAVLANDKAFW
eukprot:jgi/Psemu1/251641/estExt_Genewise1Plus.C_330046